MANFNKVILIGRLTRDPETRTFTNGGKVAKFGFAVTNRKKNSQTGQWEDEPMFIDCEVFNRGENGTLANLVEDRCRKGAQICIEGRLHLDSWDDKTTGQKRTKHKIVVDNIQLLEPRADGMGTGEGSSNRPMQSRSSTHVSGGGSSAARSDSGSGHAHEMDESPSQNSSDEEIPF